METVIDRSTYRRECLKEDSKEEKIKENKFTKLILNQVILSLAVVIGVLSIKIMNLNEAFYFINSEIESGITYETLKDKSSDYINKIKNMIDSGESVVPVNLYMEDTSLEFLNSDSIDEISGEPIYETAVEGVNQLSDDALAVKNNFSVISPLKRNYNFSIWLSMR